MRKKQMVQEITGGEGGGYYLKVRIKVVYLKKDNFNPKYSFPVLHRHIFFLLVILILLFVRPRCSLHAHRCIPARVVSHRRVAVSRLASFEARRRCFGGRRTPYKKSTEKLITLARSAVGIQDINRQKKRHYSTIYVRMNIKFYLQKYS
jgi:hypothetical protein